MAKFNINYITNQLLEMENIYCLLNWEIDGILVWQSARAQIYKSITMALNKSYKSKRSKSNLLSIINSNIKRVLLNSIILNPFLDLSKTETLVFESSRKEKVEGEYIDTYTKYLCDTFDQKNKKYTVYSAGLPLRKIRNSFNFNKSLDIISLTNRVVSLLVSKKMKKSDKFRIEVLENEINNRFGIVLDLNHIFKKEIQRFKSQYFSYRLLFKLKNPKDIFIIGSAYKAPLIKAAKDLNIIVNEIQHGLILQESIISNYPNSKDDSVEYFPNVFYLWNDLSMCNLKLPLSEKNIRYIPNYHLNYMLHKYKDRDRKHKQITVVSQPRIGNLIFEYIKENISKMMDWQFFYKLHPAENPADYNLKQNKSESNNLKFVLYETSIYEMLSESSIVIGVFSTALFEAKHFGCKIILLNLPGVELAESLIDEKNVIKINATDELIEQINFFYN